MLRRRFLSLLGCLPFGLGKAVTHTLPAPHTARDRNGDSVAEAYLLQADGSYQRVPARTLKPGDVYIMLGLDGDRLWTARLLKVGPRGVWLNKNGAYCADIKDLDDELLHKGREYVRRADLNKSGNYQGTINGADARRSAAVRQRTRGLLLGGGRLPAGG